MTFQTEEIVSALEAKSRGYATETFNMLVYDTKHKQIVRIKRDGYYERLQQFIYLGDY